MCMRLHIKKVTNKEMKFKYVSKFKNKIENTQKPFSLVYIGMISAKKQNKKISCKCTFKTWIAKPLYCSILVKNLTTFISTCPMKQ